MARSGRQRLLAPEIVQTSTMDCGPAALKALLEGFGIPVSYARLREACQTDVDGTSIDTVEEIARQLGLDAEQILVPLDHVLLDQAHTLPAIAVVRSASGGAHFVVLWRRHGAWVQVMDPARGRVWMTGRRFLDQMMSHSMTVPARSWREWAGTDAFLRPLRRRMRRAGLSRSDTETRLVDAIRDRTWRGLATLDAAVRMMASLRSVGAIRRRNAPSVLEALQDTASPASTIADHCWTVRSSPPDDSAAETLTLRGAVLVRIRGRLQPDAGARTSTEPLSPELSAALDAPPERPLREVVRTLRPDGLAAHLVTLFALLLVVGGVVGEAVLLQGALNIGTLLSAPEQRIGAVAILVGAAAALLGLELILAGAERRMGSHLDTRLRVRFLDKMPRLADAYFQSRPIADMLERSHTVHTVRMLPRLAVRFVRVGLELAVTALALAWLSPGAALLAASAALAAAAVPLLGQVILTERDLRARTHAGALARFHLDALRGRTAIEAHGAAGTIEREHEGLLAEWAGAALSLQRASIAIEGLQMVVGLGLVAWLLLGHLSSTAGTAVLLQAYWMLNLPALGYELALLAREYPSHRTTILRLLEPLGAPDHLRRDVRGVFAESTGEGVAIEAHKVGVRAAGHAVLDEISLKVAPGSHVAIVGASGAGKSTLVGLLLGWHRATEGELLVDGAPLTTARLDALRQSTAWVDPTVQIWNRSLLENLLYGSNNADGIGQVIEMAGLLSVVAKLPQGLATPLGESGALLSAGEAQRVRLGRAMLRPHTRLAILDEPFVGLERDRRRTLLASARQRWAGATLLYVTHDVAETRGFDRVIVVDRGRIMEDGEPQQLAQMASSRYRRLLLAQETLNNRFASSGDWKRIRLESGRIVSDHARVTEHSA